MATVLCRLLLVMQRWRPLLLVFWLAVHSSIVIGGKDGGSGNGDVVVHEWEVQDTVCHVKEHCRTALLTGKMEPPANPENKWDFGTFRLNDVNPHFRPCEKLHKWRVTLVDRESGPNESKKLKRVYAGHESRDDDKSPLKLCCQFFDLTHPSIRCKESDYFQAMIGPRDSIHITFGPKKAKGDRLSKHMMEPGPVEIEFQAYTCQPGKKIITLASSKLHEADKASGMVAEMEIKAPTQDTPKGQKLDWINTLARVDSLDLSEEPESMCCAFHKAEKGSLELQCDQPGFFQNVGPGSIVQLWDSSKRKPLRHRLMEQVKCMPVPEPTPQKWYQGANPAPLNHGKAMKLKKKAQKSIAHFLSSEHEHKH